MTHLVEIAKLLEPVVDTIDDLAQSADDVRRVLEGALLEEDGTPKEGVEAFQANMVSHVETTVSRLHQMATAVGNFIAVNR